MKEIPFKDLADLPEDERIRQIADKTMLEKMNVGFFVDDAITAERYIRKLKERCPGIRVVFQGPMGGLRVVFVKVAPPLN